MQPAQLDALVAIVDTGTFEAAARELHVTPSAISQRIRALEAAAGQVLVLRAAPCRPTPAGESLLRLGRQSRLLWAEATTALDAGGRVALSVAVNADSLATWWRPVLGEVGGWAGTALELHVEDQAWSTSLLRSGDCLAAVTSDPVAVQGCSVKGLGSLRYRPAATPDLAARHRIGAEPDWARLPMVVFNHKDELQHDVLTRHGAQVPAVVHRVPTSADFHEAVRLGLGWGMLPEPQLEPDLAAGRLVTLGEEVSDVALHWQRWRLDSPALDRLTDAVRRAARASLRP